MWRPDEDATLKRQVTLFLLDVNATYAARSCLCALRGQIDGRPEAPTCTWQHLGGAFCASKRLENNGCVDVLGRGIGHDFMQSL